MRRVGSIRVGVQLKYVRRLPSGRLEYRRAFPQALWPHVGKRELIRSLEASSLSEPGAMERYREAAEEYDRVLTIGRKAVAGTFDNLDAPTTAFLAEAFFVHSLAQDDERRWATRGEREARWAFKTQETLEGIVPLYRHLQAMGDMEGLLDTWTEEAGYLAEAHGYRFDEDSDAFALLCRALNEVAIRAGEARLQRLQGELIPTPQLAARVVAAPAIHSDGGGGGSVSFAALVEQELERPSFDAGHSTKEATRTALRLFGELHGKLAPVAITRAHVSQFIDALTRCPVVRGKERALPMPELIERYADQGIPRLSLKTRETHVGALQAIWNKVQRAGHIDEGRANPFANHKLGKAVPKRQRKDFSREEMKAMFALPVFTSGERPKRGKGEASYWLPLLLATTGARPEEIAQLLVADVEQNAETGEWTLTITDDGEHPHKGSRRLKTANGQRTFPVPKFLIALGFLDYVVWLRGRGDAALFPELRTKGKRKLLFAGFSEWWLRYLRDNEAYPEGRRGGRDFRHTWATIARESGIHRDAQEYIMGHSSGRSMNMRYGELRPLGDEMRRVSLDGWGLQNVRPWEVPSK